MKRLCEIIRRKTGFLAALVSILLQMSLPILHVLNESESPNSRRNHAIAGSTGEATQLFTRWEMPRHLHDRDHCTLCQAFHQPSSCLKGMKPIQSAPACFTLIPVGGSITELSSPIVGLSRARAPPFLS